ncbi:hypothetical protein, partial [Escherichia coli]
TAMSRLDAFAQIAGIRNLPQPSLSDDERTYLAGFLSGLQSSAARQAIGVPVMPANAPLTDASRLWLNGLLGGLFSHTQAVAAPSPGVTLLW